MKQSSGKHKMKAVLHHYIYIEETCCSPKTNPKNLRTLTHTRHQLNIRRHLGRHPARQPPPQNESKNLRALTPILEVRTPKAKAIWRTKICFLTSSQISTNLGNIPPPSKRLKASLSTAGHEDPRGNSTRQTWVKISCHVFELLFHAAFFFQPIIKI